jgi:hypothetical protein
MFRNLFSICPGFRYIEGPVLAGFTVLLLLLLLLLLSSLALQPSAGYGLLVRDVS